MTTEQAVTTTNEAAVEKKDARDNTLKAFLSGPAVAAKLAEVASKTMRPEALVRLALMAASRNPDIAKCTQQSILRALLDAAELGIAPGGLQGRGYLVPRKNTKAKDAHGNPITILECHFDPGWRGLLDIARRSDRIKSVEAHVIRKNEKHRIVFGTAPVLEHEPMLDGEPGEVICAYAVATFRDGTQQVEVVTGRDLHKVRGMGAEKGPWATWYEEMARKTAIRRLCKFLPYEPALDRAIEVSHAADGVDDDTAVIDMIGAESKAKALSEKLKAPVTHDADGVVANA